MQLSYFVGGGKMKRLLFVAAAVVVTTGSMFADTVSCATCVGGTSSPFPTTFGASTATFTGTNPGAASPVFWNDPSDDTGIGPGQSASHKMNIGYVLTDTGGMTGAPSVIPGDSVSSDFVATGGADPSAFNFVRNATSYNVTLIFADSQENTGNSWLNGAAAIGSVFGYYVGNTFTPIYTVGPTTSPTGTEAFNPGASGTAYGFYDTTCYAVSAGLCTDYATYTTSGQTFGNDLNGAAWNHFALFQLASGSYVIGFTGQNGLFGENIGDFQDTVIELSIAPEPGTIGIMGLGLAALGVLGRRRFARK
jgi:hypothetical protein